MTISFEDMERGRLLIRHGRAWVSISPDDIDRGAMAVVRSPQYRDEIARAAIQHATEISDVVLAAACAEAWDDLGGPALTPREA